MKKAGPQFAPGLWIVMNQPQKRKFTPTLML